MNDTSHEIQFIRATPDHLNLLVEARIDFMTEYWGRQTKEIEQNLRNALFVFFEKEIGEQSYIAWLALINNKLLSTGGMKIIVKPGSFRIPDGLSAYIMNIYTVPEYRKQGLATKIMQYLIEAGKSIGIKMFELHATAEGEPLYIKEGFIKHTEPTYRKFITP